MSIDLSSPAPPPAEAERRRRTRYVCTLTGACQPVTAHEASQRWPVEVRDVSAGGIRVQLCRRFEPGTLLALTLAGPGETVCAPLVRVQRVSRAGLYWVLGCAWVDELEKADLRLLLGKPREWQPAVARQPSG